MDEVSDSTSIYSMRSDSGVKSANGREPNGIAYGLMAGIDSFIVFS